MNSETIFETPDLYLSAALVMLLNIEPAYKVVNGKTLFCFPVSDDLYRAMSLYNAGVRVSASVYAETIKRMRAEMIMRRNRRDGK